MCRNASERQSVIWQASRQVDPPRDSPPAIRDPTQGPYRVYPPSVEYPEFMPVANLYRNRPDYDLTELVVELVEAEAVPAELRASEEFTAFVPGGSTVMSRPVASR